MDRSRGQIIIAAAFALAIVFVSLALILNAAIFTENLATRDSVDDTAVYDFRDAVGEVTEVLILKGNDNTTSETTESELFDTFRERIEAYSEAERTHSLRTGSLPQISVASVHNGTIIRQSASAPLENNSNNGTWQLAEGVEDFRRFSVTVDTITGGPTTFTVTNGTHSWELAIRESSDEATLTVSAPNGDSTTRTEELPVTVSPTNGSINGSADPAFDIADSPTGPVDFWIANGSNTTGTYEVTIDQPKSTVDLSQYSAPTSPNATVAIYNASVDLDLEQSELRYTERILVEPGETDPRS
ncbi:MAG: DUF7261 family protein [Halodesulfurarchaeum sp.]